MRYKDDEYVSIKSNTLSEAIKKSGVDQTRLSTMLLGKHKGYISQGIVRGTFNKEELEKLCKFLNIDYRLIVADKEITKKPEESKKQSNTSLVPQLETLICGSNLMYENQKSMIEIMKDMLVEIKALGTRQNRLENAMAQIVQNGAILKDNTNKINDGISNTRSTLNLISGRLKDISNDVQRKGRS